MLKSVIFVGFIFFGAFIDARPNEYDAAAETRTFENDVKEDGSYSYKYDTTNGIAVQESGYGGYYAVGSSAYYAPDGQLIQLTYQADENGFQPKGDHLPTPPPVPEPIVKALEYIRTHPNQEQRQGSSVQKPQQQQFQQQQQLYQQPKIQFQFQQQQKQQLQQQQQRYQQGKF